MSYTPNFADLSYVGKHARVRRIRGRADHCIIYLCHTGSTRFEWANISGEHRDIGDYMPMCKIHHDQYDGVNRSAESRAAAQARATGRKDSDETRARKSAASLGNQRALGHSHPQSEATRAKISTAAKVSQLGNDNASGKRSSESRDKMSAAGRRRAPISAETRAKLSAAQQARRSREQSEKGGSS